MAIPQRSWMTLFLRRIVAYSIDVACIMAYAAMLFAVTILFFPLASAVELDVADALQMQLVGIVTLTGPVVLVFAWLESRRSGATLGKWLLGLAVRRINGDRASFPRSLARNVLKFLPWEIAHMGVHQAYVASHPQSWLGIALSLAGMLLAAAYLVSCIILHGRTIYDPITGTCVTRTASLRAITATADA